MRNVKQLTKSIGARLILLITVIVMCLADSYVAHSAQPKLTVNEIRDIQTLGSNQCVINQASSVCSLRTAIETIPPGGLIEVSSDLQNTLDPISLTLGQITLGSIIIIDSDVTIKGNGIIISGGRDVNGRNPVNLFSVNVLTNVTFDSLTFEQAGSTQQAGGAIKNEGGLVTIHNCNFLDNGVTDAVGGAIYNTTGERVDPETKLC